MASPRLRDALVALLILGSAGRADADPIGPRVYRESSLRLGYVWGEARAANGYTEDRGTGLVDLRFSLGGVLGKRQVTNVRLGAVVDTGWASIGSFGVALGIVAQVDRPIDAR